MKGARLRASKLSHHYDIISKHMIVWPVFNYVNLQIVDWSLIDFLSGMNFIKTHYFPFILDNRNFTCCFNHLPLKTVNRVVIIYSLRVLHFLSIVICRKYVMWKYIYFICRNAVRPKRENFVMILFQFSLNYNIY